MGYGKEVITMLSLSGRLEVSLDANAHRIEYDDPMSSMENIWLDNAFSQIFDIEFGSVEMNQIQARYCRLQKEFTNRAYTHSITEKLVSILSKKMNESEAYNLIGKLNRKWRR